MGIINVTPDSFSDGGKYLSAQQALSHGKKLIDEGADILDIGGESTRPGSQPVSVADELTRVIPVLEGLSKYNIPISVDTSKPEVMKQAISSGAIMINDVHALKNPGALETIAPHPDIHVCLMHMQGTPQNMQMNPQYRNIVSEVKDFLQQRIEACIKGGIERHRLIIDPGFGFGKTLQHNLTLLNHLEQLTTLKIPILAGLSRKSMLGAITGNPVEQRVHESITAALLAIIKGAKIIRVHDVKASKDALTTLTSIQNSDINTL